MSTENETGGAGRPTLRLADKAPRESGQSEHTDKAKIARQFVTFTFYKARPEWRTLDAQAKLEAKREFVEAFESYQPGLLVRPFAIVILGSKILFMIWPIGYSLVPFQEM